MDKLRVAAWSAVAIVAGGAAVSSFRIAPEPTVYSIKDEHEDCGSGDDDYGALAGCLMKRYRWPDSVAEQFAHAIRYRHEREAGVGRLTDWDAFRHEAEDLRAVYRALGVRDLTEIELDIYADSATAAFTDSLARSFKDSINDARRIQALLPRPT
jgi:hypothetical protein